MQFLINVEDVAHVIQLAVAPVFLLTSIGAVLSVMTVRLSRCIDRARQLEDNLEHLDPKTRPHAHVELRILWRRARLIGAALTLCTISALLICTVVGILFVGGISDAQLGTAIALLFIAAMGALMLALLVFLVEIYLGIASLRIGPR
ncbi:MULTISPECIES: DUF2721 domain-containing protein [Methylococcus]|jgi:hypothetical protein|uniref:DUF2721 domain-containing protein n=2 Tax=Methylococcus capsulatus TaxID=414 RepID=Q607C6_METCA|nr:DUF2721 domain-containing protein [Methylococcus capsulatus]AAU91951.1 hypothetical protein MCA1835 [Methylococcus capsulatus str. Bath]QXP87518.1 DUF2721 domain-containing protein [Methylococcus capsulatus]QXP91128.1 DUF2721 domain-containing protein [Methylococcus capsulatus]QXP92742.1 DUF2721 domain-containing protein [Methylococcus capsulatus]UQN12529.1 DUF2721 domain-containing protein [Methylococcus capsulatus]